MKNRHPTGKKSKNRPSLPSISYGKLDKLILRYMFSNQDDRFNIRLFSKINNIKRSTVYDHIHTLEKIKLIKKINTGDFSITEKGIQITKQVTHVGTMSDSLRSPCRNESLSTHYFKYSIQIKEINRHRLKELNPNELKPNKLPNFTEYYLYFDDCTITVKLNQIIIHIHDLITQDIIDAHELAFNKCMTYVLSLRKIATLEGLKVFSKPHYARVESYLSKKLSKVDNRYFLRFPDGAKFWIDYSEKREDETDDPLYRERIDEIFLDAKDSKSVFSDVDRHEIDLDKIKEILLLQIKLESVKMNKEISRGTISPVDESLRDKSYFG